MSDISDDTSSNSSFDTVKQLEFDQAVEQLQLVLSIVALPFIGKYLGRKFSFWLYSRYRVFGLTSNLLFGRSVPLSSTLN